MEPTPTDDSSTLETEDQRLVRAQELAARCLEARATKREGDHRRMRGWYERLDWIVGFPAIVLAVAAGATALPDDSNWLTPWIAFAAAVFAAFQTWARAAAREQSHRERMAKCGRIADGARILRTLEMTGLTADEYVTKLKELQDRFHDIEGQATFTE